MFSISIHEDYKSPSICMGLFREYLFAIYIARRFHSKILKTVNVYDKICNQIFQIHKSKQKRNLLKKVISVKSKSGSPTLVRLVCENTEAFNKLGDVTSQPQVRSSLLRSV
ncbi:hypothetical protein Avbf_15652 [Armadillidium vulgare]|nr:hypothetical protein Avbf_15652 [Armadillidium vulgare]